MFDLTVNEKGIREMKSSSINRKPPLTKKELEKQKLIEEKRAEEIALQQFVETFEKPNSGIKTFIKGSTINGPVGAEQNAKSQVYKPSKLQEMQALEEKAKKELTKQHNHLVQNSSNKMDKPPKKKKVEKPKSNLELFKEELKMMQEEREGKSKDKNYKVNDDHKARFKNNNNVKDVPSKDNESIGKNDDFNKAHTFGSYDTGDPNTTNIYLGNISPKTTETDLMTVFGKYGPLASVKVMWPRTDEERARNRNCGFVAYMNRKDAERAMKHLQGKEILNYEMKLGWGKSVPLPPHPVYIPPKLRELTLPPPKSGLPFNAQPDPKDIDKLPPPGTPLAVMNKQDNFKEILKNATVKVVTPTDRNLLCLIHRMVEFVVREGPMFEAMIMNRELMNPMFRFLFDNQTPEHVYYRWRLFSVLQGDQHNKWRTETFRMFKDGPLWRPPPIYPFQQGMPDELLELSPDHESKIPIDNDYSDTTPKHTQQQRGFKESKEKKGMLTDSEREIFEDILRELTPEKQKIQDAMIYCIEHADAAEEIVDCVVESLSLLETPLHKKIARLYLISDVLHNCTVKVSNASYYRKGFQSKLVNVFQNIHKCYKSISGRMKAEHFKQRVMNCFKFWEDCALFSNDFLIKLQNIFLGLVKLDKVPANKESPISKQSADLDGVPINEDVDGIPMDDDVDGIPIDDSQIQSFKVSKWENIGDESIEDKPILSKWDLIKDDDIDGVPIEPAIVTESKKDEQIHLNASKYTIELEKLNQKLNSSLPEDERRIKLREIEVKVLKYQDSLETSKEASRKGVDIDQIDEYRIKLLKKCLSSYKHNDKKRSRSRSKSRNRRSSSRSPSYRYSSKSPRQSSEHRQRSKHRSRSPHKRRRSSSRSPYRSKRK